MFGEKRFFLSLQNLKNRNDLFLLTHGVMATRQVLVLKSPGSNPGGSTEQTPIKKLIGVFYYTKYTLKNNIPLHSFFALRRSVINSLIKLKKLFKNLLRIKKEHYICNRLFEIIKGD